MGPKKRENVDAKTQEKLWLQLTQNYKSAISIN